MNNTDKTVFNVINSQCCDIMNDLIKEETMKKINIAELLKDCPKGMKLDCHLFNGLEFDHIDTDNKSYPIVCRAKDSKGEYYTHTFTKYGWYTIHYDYAKCVIFPKGKTTWEGFAPPCEFKDGDVAISERGDIHLLRTEDSSYCAYRENWEGASKLDKTITTSIKVKRLATEDEKKKLFDAIKANGYKWNTETKTLEKLSKFKVGDRIVHKNSGLCCTFGEYSEGISAYRTSIGLAITDKDLEQWELAPNKFDITTLKPFDKVLARDVHRQIWIADFFSHTVKEQFGGYRFACIGHYWCQCIPYKGNEHLLGTINDCEEYFKTWK